MADENALRHVTSQIHDGAQHADHIIAVLVRYC